MITTQTFDYIVSKIDERRTELKDFIGDGTIKDFPEYQKLCGVIQGLSFAKQIVSDLAKRMETDDDE